MQNRTTSSASGAMDPRIKSEDDNGGWDDSGGCASARPSLRRLQAIRQITTSGCGWKGLVVGTIKGDRLIDDLA